MFDYARMRLGLFWLELGRQRINKASDKKRAELNASLKGEELRDALHEHRNTEMVDNMEIDEIVGEMHTRYLRSEARRLSVPLKTWDGKEFWEEGLTGTRYLNDEAINQLRAAIRAEKKSRRETVLMWVPVIGALAGLIGVATGLVAVSNRPSEKPPQKDESRPAASTSNRLP